MVADGEVQPAANSHDVALLVLGLRATSERRKVSRQGSERSLMLDCSLLSSSPFSLHQYACWLRTS